MPDNLIAYIDAYYGSESQIIDHKAWHTGNCEKGRGMLEISPMRPGELHDAALLFIDTVRTVNCADYTSDQLGAWAPADEEGVRRIVDKLAASYVLAARDGGALVGFGSLCADDELDMLYVAAGYTRRGIGRMLVCALEEEALRRGAYELKTYASITACPFFERLGYHVASENTVYRRGVALRNYLMRKRLG